jgi:hypothetical protein
MSTKKEFSDGILMFISLKLPPFSSTLMRKFQTLEHDFITANRTRDQEANYTWEIGQLQWWWWWWWLWWWWLWWWWWWW